MTRHVAPPVAGYVAVPGHARAGDVEGLVDGWRKVLAAFAGSRVYAIGPMRSSSPTSAT